jgi:gluconolactonase
MIYAPLRVILRELSLVRLLLFSFPMMAYGQEARELSVGKPDAVIDLKTTEGVALVKAQWKYSDAKIAEVDFNAPGADLKPSGPPIKTNDIFPKAGAADFDDSKWQTIAATSLEQRRGTGKVSFNWYRIRVTIPDRIGGFDPSGSTVVFEILLDDYAEVTVNGILRKSFGQSGGDVVKGYNARNRVVLTTQATPGEQFQIAVFGMNGPLSDIPNNYIWIRSATLDFYHDGINVHPEWKNLGEVVKTDTALDQLITPGTKLEKAAEGFQFTEGPVWDAANNQLLFSDPNTNVIYALSQTGNVSVYRTKSGYAGFDIGEYGQPGSNGLTFDQQGRLTVDEHGRHRVVRIEKNGVITVLADNYQGKRLNSPNDLVYRSDGALYFTDPPYGLPKFFDDARKQLPFSGVYCLINGELKLSTADLKGPNGLAFSPDEKFLYVTNWDITDIHHTKVIMRYEVNADGSLKNGRVFYDMNHEPGDLALDGMKTDLAGNLYVAGPDAIYIITPDARLLGKIKGPEHIANMAWGEDGKTLFITASTGVYKIRTNIGGIITGIATSSR